MVSQEQQNYIPDPAHDFSKFMCAAVVEQPVCMGVKETPTEHTGDPRVHL